MFKERLALIVIGFVFLLLPGVTAGTPLIPLPGEVELLYDDGNPEGGVLLVEGEIAAVRMSPDSGTWTLKTARYYLYQGEGKVRIFSNEAGSPGSDLVEKFSVTADTGGWYDVDLTAYDITVNGEFYVGIEGVDPFLNCSIGHDFLQGGNGRAWHYSPGFDWSYMPDVTYFIRMVVTNGAGVEEELVPELPITAQCSPNPFSTSTKISYTLPQADQVTINIWAVGGQLVRSLVNTDQTQGAHSLEWNGTDNSGRLLPPGVYFLKIDAEQSRLTQKVILIR